MSVRFKTALTEMCGIEHPIIQVSVAVPFILISICWMSPESFHILSFHILIITGWHALRRIC